MLLECLRATDSQLSVCGQSRAVQVILSLEMHCSRKQQRVIAATLTRLLGDQLLPYEELSAIGGAKFLSPLDIKRRIL